MIDLGGKIASTFYRYESPHFSMYVRTYGRRGAVIRHRNADDCQEEEVEEDGPASPLPLPSSGSIHCSGLVCVSGASSNQNRLPLSVHTRPFKSLVQSLEFTKAAMSKRKAPQESPNEGITDFLVGT